MQDLKPTYDRVRVPTVPPPIPEDPLSLVALAASLKPYEALELVWFDRKSSDPRMRTFILYPVCAPKMLDTFYHMLKPANGYFKQLNVIELQVGASAGYCLACGVAHTNLHFKY